MVKRASCWSGSHRHLKNRARARLDDLQTMLFGLQSARKDGRATDAAAMEEQVQQILEDWKDELGGASPAPSGLGDGVLVVGAAGQREDQVSSNLSLDIHRLLQLCDEEGEATSKLSELPPVDPKPEPLEVLDSDLQIRRSPAFQEGYFLSQEFQGPDFIGDSQYKSTSSMGLHHACLNSIGGSGFGDCQQRNMHQEFNHNVPLGFATNGQNGVDLMTQITGLIPAICPPPSAFLRPKCALWDCPRPAHGSEWWQDYCSIFHATLAFNEGPPGMSPVLRPGGIDLKDGPLFAALSAKTQGKNVGIPECEGAATTKSPWNAPELFDLLVLNGESLREWLFFDKPRKAFESGSRKQRSLPDYNGRGWHESRKQVMKEFGGLKRSYYMDPQPLRHYEWHLYEYEISNYDACALYRLELKLVDSKKSIKGKITSDSLTDLQQQMGRLNAEIPVERKQCLKARVKVNRKDATENVYLASYQVDQKETTPLDQTISIAKSLVYELSLPSDHSDDYLSECYRT